VGEPLKRNVRRLGKLNETTITDLVGNDGARAWE
jgi:hypothetical protein